MSPTIPEGFVAAEGSFGESSRNPGVEGAVAVERFLRDGDVDGAG
ncbi:MAG: hypothetical protein P8N50_12435 [Actinomycetota bacterium]|jgi:hypothetical protein|nr:hypothetical protein [Actinomycetota bacterium]